MEPFLGQIQMFGFNFAPRGWAFCDGQLLSISQNTAVFSLLGTTFGGDGRTTFGLPDLRGRSAVHVGSGPGLTPISWGQRSGQENVTLGVQNLPPHSHAMRGVSNAAGDETNPAGAAPAVAADEIYSTNAPNTNMAATSNTGGGQPLSIRDPYVGIYHSIALVGIFPSRN